MACEWLVSRGNQNGCLKYARDSRTRNEKFQGKRSSSITVMRSGSISDSVILRRFLPGKVVGKRGSSEHLLGLRVRVVRLNFTLFKGSTIGATRGRKVTPRPHPLSRALQGFKQLRMVHGSSREAQCHRRIFYNWILYTSDANPPFRHLLFDTVLETRTLRVSQRPHVWFINVLETILCFFQFR